MFLRRAPQPLLSQFVRVFWYWEGEAVPHPKERLLPSGESELVINLRDEPMRIYDWRDTSRFETFGHSLLSGARTEPFVIDTASEDHVLGVHFCPGGVFPFLDLPASELHNLCLPLDVLWRGGIRSLRDRLLEAATVEARFSLVEDFLIGQLRKPLEHHPAVAYALGHFCRIPHAITVASVTDRIGLSARRFIQVFHDQVGLTPKAFCRVRRFQRVLDSIHGASEVDWSQVALDCGYYDQAHFIHDFQEFSGLRPTAYLSAHTPHLNHVPLPK